MIYSVCTNINLFNYCSHVFYYHMDNNYLFRIRIDNFNAEQCACAATDSVVPRE